MRARLIGRAQGRPEPVGELDEIAVGDKGVAQSLLLLLGKRQQCGLANRARLNSAGDCEVGGERSLAIHAVGKGGDRRQALKHRHVGHALRVGPCASHHQGEKADPASQSAHSAPPPLASCGPILLRHRDSVHEPEENGQSGRQASGPLADAFCLPAKARNRRPGRRANGRLAANLPDDAGLPAPHAYDLHRRVGMIVIIHLIGSPKQ